MMRTRDFLGLNHDGDAGSSGGVFAAGDLDQVNDEFVVGEFVGRMSRSGRSTVNSNFAPKDLFDAVRGWNDEQLDLIRGMGLPGLLMLDRFTHFNRDFSQFVLQCIDTDNSRLALGKNRYASLDEHVFCQIVGAREGGDVEIQRTTGPPTAHEIYDARSVLGLPGQTELSTLQLLHVLRQEDKGEMTVDLAIRLRTAYAMLAISVFFSPRDRRGYVPRDAYIVAREPADLCNLNWSRYGVEELLDGAWRVQDSYQRGIRGFTVYGCLLAAQCLHFDNVGTGTMTVAPGVFPRIGQYTATKLKALIQRDTLLLPHEKIYGMLRGIVSRSALMESAPIAHRRRPSVLERSAPVATSVHDSVEPVNLLPVAPYPQVPRVSQCGAHLPPAPTVDSILHGIAVPDDQIPGDQIPHAPHYDGVLQQARAWLRHGFSEIDRKARLREAAFYRGIMVYDENTMKAVEAFYISEKVVRMQAIHYLLNHLVERGVGNYIPSLLVHYKNVTNILRGLPGFTGSAINLGEFIDTCMSEDVGYVDTGIGGSGSSGLSTAALPVTGPHFQASANGDHVGSSSHSAVQSGYQVFNPTPLRCVPMSGGAVSNNHVVTDAVAELTMAVRSQMMSTNSSGSKTFFPVPVMTQAPLRVVTGPDTFDSPLNMLATTAVGIRVGVIPFPDLSQLGGGSEPGSVSAPGAGQYQGSPCVYLPNEIGQNSVDMGMVAGVCLSGPSMEERGKSVCDGEGGGVIRKRDMMNLSHRSEGLEYIVYTATKAKRSRVETNFVLTTKKKLVNHVPGLCPFSHEFSFGLPGADEADAGYMNMIFCRQEYMKSLWVIHLKPELLKMNGFDVLTVFHKNGALTDKGLEIVRRGLTAVEDSWYGADDRSRFRCYMPKKWMDLVMDGGDFTTNSELRAMFTGIDIHYDVETCHLVWIPKRNDDGTYVLYGVDFMLEMIHVMDPKMTSSGRSVLRSIHRDTCVAIIDAFAACTDAFYEGWRVDKEDWSFVYHEFLHPTCSDDDSGWYLVYYMMNFDGLTLTEEPTPDMLVELRTKLMMMVLNMPGNIGHAPECIKNPFA